MQQDPEVLSEPESQDSAAARKMMDGGDVSCGGDDDDDDVLKLMVSTIKNCSHNYSIFFDGQ